MDQEKGLLSRKLQKAVNEGSNHRMFILSRSAESLKKELYTHIKKKKNHTYLCGTVFGRHFKPS